MSDKVKFQVLGSVIILAIIAVLVPLLYKHSQVNLAPLNETVKAPPKTPVITIDLGAQSTNNQVQQTDRSNAALPGHKLSLKTNIDKNVTPVQKTVLKQSPPNIISKDLINVSNEKKTIASVKLTSQKKQDMSQPKINDSSLKIVSDTNNKTLTANNIKDLKPKPTPTVQKPAIDNPQWVIQLGTFSKVENAQRLKKRLQDDGFTAFIKSKALANGGQLSQVFIGPQTSQDAANTLQKIKQNYALQGFIKKIV